MCAIVVGSTRENSAKARHLLNEYEKREQVHGGGHGVYSRMYKLPSRSSDDALAQITADLRAIDAAWDQVVWVRLAHENEAEEMKDRGMLVPYAHSFPDPP